MGQVCLCLMLRSLTVLLCIIVLTDLSRVFKNNHDEFYLYNVLYFTKYCHCTLSLLILVIFYLWVTYVCISVKLLELLPDSLKEDSCKSKFKFISNDFEINRISLNKSNERAGNSNYSYLRDNFI